MPDTVDGPVTHVHTKVSVRIWPGRRSPLPIVGVYPALGPIGPGLLLTMTSYNSLAKVIHYTAPVYTTTLGKTTSAFGFSNALRGPRSFDSKFQARDA